MLETIRDLIVFVIEDTSFQPSYLKEFLVLLKWREFHRIGKGFYPNSGCVVGYAGAIHDMISWILRHKDNILDDQVGISMYMNQFPQHAMLDLQNKLVLNDNWGKTLSFSVNNGKIEGVGSYFIHFPGMMVWF